ncbi:MAG: hypothetical protein AMXMBFR84_44570 [Candidatus Hydrogenedentota bacterium]
MGKPKPKTVQSAFLRRLKTNFRGYTLRGILILVPLGVTSYVLILCYRLTAGHLVPFLRKYTGEMPEYAVVLLSIVLFLGMLYFIGSIAGFVIGRRLIAIGEGLLRRIPIVKTVYGASRQAVDSLSTQDEQAAYQAAVLAPFPSLAIRSIAFITGKVELSGIGTFFRTFVPTTPNPTSGYFVMYPPEMVEYTTLTMEDAAKAMISAGILTPAEFEVVSGQNGSKSQSNLQRAPQAAAVKAVQIRQNRKRPWYVRDLLIVRKRLISGMLVLVPIGVTAFIVKFIYDLTAGRMAPATRWIAGALQEFLRQQDAGRLAPIAKWLSAPMPGYVTAALSIILLMVLLYTTGYLATAYFGNRLVRMTENLIGRLPVITSVYGATKQILETLFDSSAGPKFEAPVIVDFPFPGVKTMGFVVGRIRSSTGTNYVKVFVPTTPNITVGLLELFLPEHVMACNLTLEESIKMIVSGGIVGPDSIDTRPYQDVPEIAKEPEFVN